MKIGAPREIANHKCRDAITPVSLPELTRQDYHVVSEKGDGLGSSWLAGNRLCVQEGPASW